MSSSDHTANGQLPQDDLTAYFNKSASAVQCYVDHFEHDVVKPAFASSHMFFKERPITATFVAIFSLLSFLPVLAFVASIFTIATVFLVALFTAALTCGMAGVTLLSFLLFALFVNLFIALFFTGLLTFAFMLLRLASLVREKGTDGISSWTIELQELVLGNGGSPHVGEAAFDSTKLPISHIDAQDEKATE